MTKEEIIDNIARLNSETWKDREEVRMEIGKLLTELKKALEQQPCDETIKYLECNDIDVQKFTEAMKKQRLQVIKPNICDDCVSRTDLIDKLEILDKRYGSDFYWEVRKIVDILPPVTPTQCIATVRFSKDDLREICNERIEIECTHGTCKDCKHWKDSDGVYRRGVDAESKCPINIKEVYEGNFYCKEFKKRGSENG